MELTIQQNANNFPENDENDFSSEPESVEEISGDENTDLEDDGTPVLDEEDVEENDLTEEEADEIDWETEEKK
jgi:hypothetical protein